MIEGGIRISNPKIKKKEPLITIITVVKNGEKFLEECIKSVLNQSYKDFEYIIIDGNSTDRTHEIIKKYENFIEYYLIDEDKGLYDGFNKGMKYVNGKYFGYVNSDDVLLPNALKILSEYINYNPTKDFFFGAVKKHWGVLWGYKPWKINFSWGFYSSHSTGFFLKNKSAKKVGLYNLKYRYHADYDYFYRLIAKYKMKGTATKKKELVGIFRRGGFSSTISFRKLFFEELKIRWDNKQNILIISIIFIYKFIKHFKKIIKL